MRRDPSALARKIWVRVSLRSSSMIDWVSAHATRLPSGEGITPPMVLNCIENSGVQTPGTWAKAMPTRAANQHTPRIGRYYVTRPLVCNRRPLSEARVSPPSDERATSRYVRRPDADETLASIGQG